MKKTHWPTRLAAGCLVTLTLVGVAFAAGQQGSQSDPLVTLSYLTQKATPSILSQVDGKLTAREAELNRQLHVFLYDEGLAFGTPDELLPFSACRPRLYTDMAVLRFEGGAVMAVPKRVMTPEDWQLFTDRLSPVAEKMESPREKE